MTRQTYDERVLTRYLLDELPEDETVRFDELSFTDDEWAEALEVVEKDLVDSYVRGELSGQALEQFKSVYLTSPLRREKIRFAQAFQVFAEKAAAQEITTSEESSAESRKRFSRLISGLSLFTRPGLGWQWGLASAALVLLLVGGWLMFENVRLRHQMSQTQARREALGHREQELQKELEGQRLANAKTEQELARVREEREGLEQELKQQVTQAQQQAAGLRRAPERQRPSLPGGVNIASFVLTPQMRGVEQIPVVSIPARTDDVAMRLELEPNDYPTYRVALLDRSGNRTLWRSGKLRAGAAGDNETLSIRFRAGLLEPQTYRLRVSGVSANGESKIIGDYPFRVVK